MLIACFWHCSPKSIRNTFLAWNMAISCVCKDSCTRHCKTCENTLFCVKTRITQFMQKKTTTKKHAKRMFLTLFSKVHKKSRFWNEISPFRVCTRIHAQNTPNTQIMHKNHANHMVLSLFAKMHQKRRFWTEIWPFRMCARKHVQNVPKRVKTHCSAFTLQTLSLCTKPRKLHVF